MSQRPANLPDYTNPPVTEVALGVQFGSIEKFQAVHLGAIWQHFKSDFPHVEEHPPVPPAFETFGQNPQPMTGFLFPFPNLLLPRVFFINNNRTQLLQIQRDRFLHNWRKVGADPYPRFEAMIKTFADGYRRFSDAVSSESLGPVIPNQCEVSYINQIIVPSGESPFDLFDRLFGHFTPQLAIDELGKPEDARFMLRYIIRDQQDAAVGRLTVTAEPARRFDGETIVQLTLTVRGNPAQSDLAGVIDFLTIGRKHIVQGFTALTGAGMHEAWGRIK